MENGSGEHGSALGAPIAGWELYFDSWPPPGTVAKRFYAHADGSLQDFAPTEAASASSFLYDNAKGQETYRVRDSFEKALPNIQWLAEQPDRQVVFLSEPLTEDIVSVGHASADLWIQASAPDADLEVMLSEVRADGQERYISSGWLRASRRALSPESTELMPVQTHVEADSEPLPAGEWTLMRVEIYPFAHALRAGTQLRVAVATPGGNKGRWKFDVLQLDPGATVAVAHDADHPSSLAISTLPGVVVPTPLPACPSLRSQPCRTHVPQLNAIFE
jgi:putative CocE/NonD family hydrolase